MDPGSGGGGAGRAQAERWLSIAEKLLAARDLVGCKRFAERALELDPFLDSPAADQILAAADVLLVSQNPISSPYSILSIDPSADLPAIARAFRRLVLLLRDASPAAASAYKLVTEAFAALSDPSKKAAIDAELRRAANANANACSEGAADPRSPDRGSTFWTVCPSCRNAHEYAREFLGRSLRCSNCKKAYEAAELPAAPQVVPGTNMYYCSWGFYPIGIPSPSDLANGWKPFVPMSSMAPPPPKSPDVIGLAKDGNGVEAEAEVEAEQHWEVAPGRNKKKVARKRVGSNLKRRVVGESMQEPMTLGPEAWEGTGMRNSGININEAAEGDKVGGRSNVGSIHIDLDADAIATDVILGNLQHLPFLKDEEIHIQIP